MGSEQNKGTSFPPSDQPILCANGCGKAAAETKMKKITLTQVLQPAAVETKMKKITLTQVLEPAAAVLIDDKPAETKAANRCFTCRKKVRLVGFKCRCGSTFCGEHRYPEKHECSFDYKGAGREVIAKANPIVKADKLERC